MRKNRALEFVRQEVSANADIWQTGGGCTAIGIPCEVAGSGKPDGHWLLTDCGYSAPERIGAPCELGRYSEDGDHWICFDCRNLRHALDLIAAAVAVSL